MRNHLAQRHSRHCGTAAHRTASVCVVDPRSDDYQEWISTAQASGVRLHLVASAEAALRLARSQSVDLWVVNTTLPGLSGFELCGLLKNQTANTPVYMIADQYDPSDEQAAWRAKATCFGCKGAHGEWFAQWLDRHGPLHQPRRSSALEH